MILVIITLEALLAVIDVLVTAVLFVMLLVVTATVDDVVTDAGVAVITTGVDVDDVTVMAVGGY